MKPIFDRLVIKQEEAKDVTKGGIIIPDSGKQESPRGTVIAAGYECQYVKEGYQVLFNINYHQRFTHNGVEYVTITEKDVLAVLDGEDEVSQTRLPHSSSIQVNGKGLQ